LACFVAVGGALAATSCESPVDAALLEEQGDEVSGVRTGEFHRYGQDCMACHGGYSSAPVFVAAGTVFATPDDDIPVSGAKVILTDALGNTHAETTNCAGNFFVQEREFEPQYPLNATIEYRLPGESSQTPVHRVVMGSRINREGGCAFCHVAGPPSSTSPGWVYLEPTQPSTPFTVPTGKNGGQCEGGPSHGSVL